MRLTTFILAATCLFVSGCHTRRPLSDPATSKSDQNLFGHWSGSSENAGKRRSTHLFIGANTVEGNPESIFELVVILYEDHKIRNFTDSSPIGPKMYFTTTQVGNLRLMNVLGSEKEAADLSKPNSYATWSKRDTSRCAICSYEILNDVLTIRMIDDKKLGTLVENGTLKTNGDFISESSLIELLRQSKGDVIFDDATPLVLKKSAD